MREMVTTSPNATGAAAAAPAGLLRKTTALLIVAGIGVIKS